MNIRQRSTFSSVPRPHEDEEWSRSDDGNFSLPITHWEKRKRKEPHRGVGFLTRKNGLRIWLTEPQSLTAALKQHEGVFVLISPEDCDTCECDECVVCFVEFVIASKNTPELFDITEITFYNVASLVQFLIIFPRFLAIALRRKRRKRLPNTRRSSNNWNIAFRGNNMLIR